MSKISMSKNSIMKNPLQEILINNLDFKEFYDKALKEGMYLHAITKIPEEWAHLSEKEKEDRSWYLPICSLDEIERIFTPTNVSNILLSLRAESIISNMRILRTFEKRACYVKESDWTLTDQFDDSIFEIFNNAIDDRYKKRIDEISFGTQFSDQPNGYCIKTIFGPLIILSEALNKFFYFMNLGLYPYWCDINNERVSKNTQQQAIFIGIRTMLLTESFDFELDPRGIIPEDVDNNLKEIVNAEMLFVIAHEYAHFLLNHLDNNNVINKAVTHAVPSKSSFDRKCVITYNQSQNQEFDADSFAIKILSGDDTNKKRDVLLFAVNVLSYFGIFESVIQAINSNVNSLGTHPPAYERVKRIKKIGKKIWNDDELKTCNALIDISKLLKEELIRFYIKNPSAFTKYGSIYIDQWRGKPKIDRIDY